MFALPLPTPNAASATSTSWACGATSSSSRSMLTTTSENLGSAKASVLRRVTTTTFLHSGFLIRSCTMRPPTFPVAPSTIAEYCAFPSAAAAAIVTSHARGTRNTHKSQGLHDLVLQGLHGRLLGSVALR